jgi:hypothetical protein
MESVERQTRDIFDDNLDDDGAILEGHLRGGLGNLDRGISGFSA